MAHVQVDPAKTSTTFAPEVYLTVGPMTEKGFDIHLEFSSSYIDENRWTRIAFGKVREYRWISHAVNYVHELPEDDDLCLIAINYEDSTAIFRMREHAQILIKDFDVHHYRIRFDDIGLLEVISQSATVETSAGRRAGDDSCIAAGANVDESV